MQTIEVTDPTDFRRAKQSQYAGSPRAILLNGELVTGLVRSVAEVPATVPSRWIVTVLPMAARQTVEKPRAKAMRRR
ncbi:MAG: hypothetical protein JWR89_5238 [Tardiphaga sp.]|jgi:hypothetical protein|nr:hypothetical protein [Tardiphaga sp.]